jgi:hypothetical protein
MNPKLDRDSQAASPMGAAPSSRLRVDLEFVWIGAGVLAGLCLLGSLWVLAAADEFPNKVPTITVLGLLWLIWSSIFWGLKKGRPWGWWLAAVVFGLLGTASIVGCIWGWIYAALEGFGDRHGVGAAGQLMLCVLLTLAAAAFGYPFFMVLRARHDFMNRQGEGPLRRATRP